MENQSDIELRKAHQPNDPGASVGPGKAAGSASIRACRDIEWAHPAPAAAKPGVPALFRGRDGVEREVLRRRAQAGVLVLVGRNVYVASEEWNGLDEPARRRLRHIAAGLGAPGSVLTGRSAAYVHGLAVLDDGTQPVELGHSGDRRTREKAGIVRRWLRWGGDDIVEVDGVQVTSVAATVVDVARWHGFAEGLMAADSALRLGHCRSELALAAWSLRTPGVAAEVVAHADGAVESPGESAARAPLLLGGITGIVPQVNVFGPDKILVGRVDLLLPKELVAVEYHGGGKFSGAYGDGGDRFAGEWWRERNLLQAGLGVVRIGWSDVQEGRVSDMVREAIAERARMLAAGVGFAGWFLPNGHRWPDGFTTRSRARRDGAA
ncbi:hypothetical protein [Corynebacterium sp. 335C]